MVWEGHSLVDLLQAFAPWAINDETQACRCHAVCCCLKAVDGGFAKFFPISEDTPLCECRHYVAGIELEPTAVAGQTDGRTEFERIYHKLDIVVLGCVMDGDCGVDVMTMMLGMPQNKDARSALRVEISDYLIARVEEMWMHDLMVACQELRQEDVTLSRAITSDACVDILLGEPAPPAEIPQPQEDAATEPLQLIQKCSNRCVGHRA